MVCGARLQRGADDYLRGAFPDLKIRLVNVADLMTLAAFVKWVYLAHPDKPIRTLAYSQGMWFALHQSIAICLRAPVRNSNQSDSMR